MNTPTPETDELIKTLIETRGMCNAVFTAEITSKCQMIERQRNAAIDELCHLADLLDAHFERGGTIAGIGTTNKAREIIRSVLTPDQSRPK
jgi:hypothetical protein